jgi:predicted phage tail protein
MDKIIRGSKGGSRSRQPVRAEDTLNSKEFATIQDLLSEGEIEGFATPSEKGIARNNANYNNACLADIFLDNTAILNISPSDPNFNTKLSNLTSSDLSFQDVTFFPKFGESNQKPVGNLENANLQKTSNTILQNSAFVTTSSFIDSPNLSLGQHAVEVTIQFPALQKFEDNGDVLGTEINYKIQLETNNSNTFVDMVDETIKGRSKDSYSREHTINLPNSTFGTVNYTQAKIRVVRVTADSDPDKIQDTFRVARIEEVVYTAQSYPDCAYSTLRLSAEQFNVVPQRAFRIRGIKVRIPGAGANNSGTPTVVKNQADADTLGLGTVSSFGFIHYPAGYIFNGTMGAAQWCTCPAMILLDLLTNQRYGLGVHISPDQSTDAKTFENIDLFSYVQASRYANADSSVTGTKNLITLADGTKEARFVCNASIQGTAEAYQLINELAGVMRAFPIWQTGSITLTQDRPTDSSYLFSLANVGEGGFSYSGSSLKQRHSVVSVSYFNMDSREIDYEVFEDTTAINKLGGIIKKTVKAFGCTSRTQAERLAKAILFSEQNESEIVSFTTSIDAGVIVRPGNVISISDPVRSGERRSGRIKAATTTSVTVDNSQNLDTFLGTNKTLSVILPDGKMETKDVVLGTGGITNNNTVINVSSAFSQTPSENSIWMLSSSGVDGAEPQKFRVISVEEQDGINYAITALTYLPGKYDNIELGTALPPRNISLLNRPKEPPTSLVAEEIIIIKNNLAVPKIILSWPSVVGVTQYQVQYRFNNSNWIVANVIRPDFELENTKAGTYEFKVFSFNAALKLSETFAFLSYSARGKQDPPGNVENLSIEPITNKLVRLRWNRSIDPDVIHGGRVYVRYSNLTDGSGTFKNSIDLVTALPGNSTDALVPSLEGEYILKFQDDQGNFSLGETSVIQDLPDLIDTQIIINGSTVREDLQTPKFQGNKINTIFSSASATPPGTDALQLSDPSIVRTGTYSQSGTTITITSSSHGIAIDELIKIRFTSGEAINGIYTVVSVPNSNVLTVTSVNNTNTSGNVAIDRGLIGIYEFNNILDLGGVFSVDLRRVVRSIGFNIGTDIETLIPNDPPELGGPPDGGWDNYATDGNFDGTEANEANCLIQVATSQLGSGTFGSFNNFANGTFKGQRFKFRLLLQSSSTTQNMNVQQAGFFAEFQSRTEQNYQTASGTSTAPQNTLNSSGNPAAKTVTFGTPFFTGTSALGGSTTAFLPSVGITIQNAQGGDFFTVTNVSGTQFTVTIKNRDTSGNETLVNRTFTFSAVGYGKGV